MNKTDEISRLVGLLNDTEQRLEQLTGGEVDAVAGRDGRMFLLQRVQESSRRNDMARQEAILNALPAGIALLDTQGVIVSANDAWLRGGVPGHGLGPGQPVGSNYLRYCEKAVGEGAVEIQRVGSGIRSVLSGDAATFSLEYASGRSAGKCWFLMTANALAEDRHSGAVVMHVNVTDQKLAAQTLRDSEERFRATFEQAAVGMIHVAPDGRFLRVNDKFCEITVTHEKSYRASPRSIWVSPETMRPRCRNPLRCSPASRHHFRWKSRCCIRMARPCGCALSQHLFATVQE